MEPEAAVEPEAATALTATAVAATTEPTPVASPALTAALAAAAVATALGATSVGALPSELAGQLPRDRDDSSVSKCHFRGG